LKSEVNYSGKDLIRFQKTHDKKKEEGKPKNIWREKCFNTVFRAGHPKRVSKPVFLVRREKERGTFL